MGIPESTGLLIQTKGREKCIITQQSTITTQVLRVRGDPAGIRNPETMRNVPGKLSDSIISYLSDVFPSLKLSDSLLPGSDVLKLGPMKVDSQATFPTHWVRLWEDIL